MPICPRLSSIRRYSRNIKIIVISSLDIIIVFINSNIKLLE
jgi:hypothetical protein